MIKIEVLGTGCAKCKRLYANAEQAVKDLKISAEIVKVEDIGEIVSRVSCFRRHSSSMGKCGQKAGYLT